MSFISAKDLYFAYPGTEQHVLRGLSFEIEEGSFVAIQGPSGSGKSTLLYLLGAMNRVQSGDLHVAGKDLNQLDRSEAALFRASQVGFIFQQFHLLPRLSLLDNVKLGGLYPLEIAKDSQALTARAEELLSDFGLSEKRHQLPSKVSGGQQQRVAIARALMQKPGLILADEPTGNLDTQNSKLVLQELKKLHQEGHTVVLITHDSEVARQADRILHIRDGRLESEEVLVPSPQRTKKLDQAVPTWKTTSYNREILTYLAQNAWNQLTANKVRSFLTMLGVTIGVASVLAMMTLGSYARSKILEGYAEMGVNTFLFYGNPKWDLQTKDVKGSIFTFFKWDTDIVPLKRVFPEIKRMAPVLNGWDVNAVFGGRTINEDARLMGVSEDSFLISKRKLAIGNPINTYHVNNRSAVCVIGYEVAERLFSNALPLGQILFLVQDDQEIPCRVIGVAAKTSSRNEWRKPNLEIYVPYTYFQAKNKKWWSTQIRQIMIETVPSASSEAMGNGLKAFFGKKYGTTAKFRADSDAVLVEQMNRFLNIFSGFLAAIALVSLSVGGVGIANMMLVSLNERIREVGLRKALGATDRSLRYLILMESVLICGLAGLIGLVIGFFSYQVIVYAATKFVSKLQYEWIFNPIALIISFGSIVAVGILSGLIPAMRAEKLAPMQALRTD
ncbi:ABC transporter permease [Bdellovibrio sp. HCB337]|uniref:ABC transporter permease n=1 Tax=Bdellovibrio sp. HCB337 TaxID=3394358 RepID=UPI0039A6EAF5